MKKGIIVAIIILVMVGVGAFVMINNQKAKTEVSGQKETAKEETKTMEYEFTYQGKTIKVNDIMDKEKIGPEKNFYEIPSCAFEGMDKIYEYENFEIETYTNEEKEERIYSIYFTDTKQTTTEGVCVSDSYDKMIETYGEDFKQDGTQYSYIKEDTCLEFIVENNFITSIKYVLKTSENE